MCVEFLLFPFSNKHVVDFVLEEFRDGAIEVVGNVAETHGSSKVLEHAEGRGEGGPLGMLGDDSHLPVAWRSYRVRTCV